LPHVLLTSNGGGLGKTTFAQILANEMYCPLVSTSGQCLASVGNLRTLLVRLQPNTMLLVDEFHGISRQVAEELLLVLEEHILNVSLGVNAPVRIRIPPFTLIAATTRPSAISGPLMQRFGLNFQFDLYSVEELRQIVRGLSERISVVFDETVCDGIARRSLGVPRLARTLCFAVRDVSQAKGLSTAGIDEMNLAMSLEGNMQSPVASCTTPGRYRHRIDRTGPRPDGIPGQSGCGKTEEGPIRVL
jgi:Holliday junction DNA helicase RuvB